MTLKTPVEPILKINGMLLHSFLLAGGAWWLWPSSPKWWGFGLISILLGIAAFGKAVVALRDIIKLHAREKEIAHLAATSRAPDPSDLADQNALKTAGMLDD